LLAEQLGGWQLEEGLGLGGACRGWGWQAVVGGDRALTTDCHVAAAAATAMAAAAAGSDGNGSSGGNGGSGSGAPKSISII